MSWKCQRLAPNWGHSQFYILHLFILLLSTSISVLEKIYSSIMQRWPREFNPRPPQLLSCLNLAIQPQHEQLHDVAADLFRVPSIRTSQQRKSVSIKRSTLILVVPRLPALCHLLYLDLQVQCCSVQKWIPSIVSLRCGRNHLTAIGVPACLMTAISEVCLKRNSSTRSVVFLWRANLLSLSPVSHCCWLLCSIGSQLQGEFFSLLSYTHGVQLPSYFVMCAYSS